MGLKHTQWHSYRQSPEESNQHVAYNGVCQLAVWYVVLWENDGHISPRFCVQPDLPEASNQLCCTSLPSYCKHRQSISLVAVTSSRFTYCRAEVHMVIFSINYFHIPYIILFKYSTVYHLLFEQPSFANQYISRYNFLFIVKYNILHWGRLGQLTSKQDR